MGKTIKLFFPPFPQTLEIDEADFHIPTLDCYYEEDYLLKTRPLRDTHSRGKAISPEKSGSYQSIQHAEHKHN
jgi:hypothetical protein